MWLNLENLLIKKKFVSKHFFIYFCFFNVLLAQISCSPITSRIRKQIGPSGHQARVMSTYIWICAQHRYDSQVRKSLKCFFLCFYSDYFHVCLSDCVVNWWATYSENWRHQRLHVLSVTRYDDEKSFQIHFCNQIYQVSINYFYFVCFKFINFVCFLYTANDWELCGQANGYHLCTSCSL